MAQPKFPVRKLLSPVVDWTGKPFQYTAPSFSSSQRQPFGAYATCSSTDPNNPTDLWQMFLTPYIFAGVRFRDISRIWTGASETKSDSGDIIAPAQVQATDQDGQEIESEQLAAVRWMIDERIKRDMKQVLEQSSYPKLIFGKSVQEIMWVRETEGEYAGKIVIDDFRSVDPTLFEFDPDNMPPGMYIRRPAMYGRPQELEPVDPRRFLVITNHMLFEDRDGISELEPLRKAEPRREDAEKSWGRGAQRHGHGHIIGYYDEMLLGSAANADRELFQTSLEEMGTDTVTMAYKGNEITQLDVAMDAVVFKTLIDEEKMQIGAVLTGSTSTYIDAEGGTQARLESDTVRTKSDLEQSDCADISAAFTEQVIRRFCDFNWTDTDVYPFMQIVTQDVIAPTTPETQYTQTEIADDEEARPAPPQEAVKQSVQKFQEEDPQRVPVPIPAGNNDFPRTTPTPPQYLEAIDFAKAYLEDEIDAMPYKEIPDGEGARVFSVKRLQNFQGLDQQTLLQELKLAIVPTLDMENEEQAWISYYDKAVIIFNGFGITMDPAIRSDLNISFRQARQNAFAGGLLAFGREAGAVGVRIKNLEDGHTIRTIHKFWDGVAVPLDHAEVQPGGRLRTPLDFGCVCGMELVYNTSELTPETEWPQAWPGSSYKYYGV